MGIIIISTYPDKRSVEKIANTVVTKGLAACVNYTKINSIYSWKGRIEKPVEFLALFKTTARSKSLLKKEIAKSHPYQVPEIAEMRMGQVNAPYRRWLEESTRKGIAKK